ncbi:MAG: (2Fe-2S) ferredoxin domain-containing protein [Heteroscytonema crispum UTEX LB 1556]
MGKFNSTKVSEFCLEGRFLDFVIKDGYKLKGLRLATSEGECYVKLAKNLRAAFDLRLPPGTWLQVVGEKKHDIKTDEVKLKAERVLAARVEEEKEIRDDGCGATGVGDKESSLGVAVSGSGEVKAKSAAKAKATILVCQKSDCMKRGGTGVCKALEAALSDRSLSFEVTIKGTGCMKNCKGGPNVVMPDKTRYSRINAAQVPALMDKHFAAKSTQQQQEDNREVAVPMVSSANAGYIATI